MAAHVYTDAAQQATPAPTPNFNSSPKPPHAPWPAMLQIRVCDIDTGIRASHEDLKGNLIGGWNK